MRGLRAVTLLIVVASLQAAAKAQADPGAYVQSSGYSLESADLRRALLDACPAMRGGAALELESMKDEGSLPKLKRAMEAEQKENVFLSMLAAAHALGLQGCTSSGSCVRVQMRSYD